MSIIPFDYSTDWYMIDKARNWNRPVYVTQAELYLWARDITSKTQEGEPYHDSLQIYQNACNKIAEFFDGTWGTFPDPLNPGQIIEYPKIANATDIADIFVDEFNGRKIGVSWIAPNLIAFNPSNNEMWYYVLVRWAKRIEKFCKFNKRKYQKLLQLSVLSYNPIADYWTNEQKIGGDSQIDIMGDSNDKFNVYAESWYNNKEYKSESANQSGGSAAEQSPATLQSNHYTTTYDDASQSRLESYDTQTGGTTTHSTQTNPAEGYFEQRKEQGNKGGSIQDIIEKEFDIAGLWNIVRMFMDELAKELYLVGWDVI